MHGSSPDASGFLARTSGERRAFEEVILQVRRAIAEGRLHVGDRLPDERELARLLAVSRQSVREGLRMLEAFGVVVARRGAGPDSGWIVSANGTSGLGVLLDLHTSLQRTPLWDFLEIREALEMRSARSAASRASGEERRQLIAAAERMEATTEIEQFFALDTDFHVAIARASGNSLAPLFMEAIREAMSRAMFEAFDRLENWQAERTELAIEHRDVAEAIRDGHADAASEAVSRHIRGFYGRALRGPGEHFHSNS